MNLIDRVFNILILEDSFCNLGVWCVDILESEGYSCTLVDKKALLSDSISRQSADLLLVFSDINDKGIVDRLPGIKSELNKHYVSVILLTENFNDQTDTESIVRCCDDFMLMPVNKTALKAKVRCLLNSRLNAEKQFERNKKLLEYQHVVDQEKIVAAKLYEKILRDDYLETTVVKVAISPEALFNGDFLYVSRTPDNNLYILLGDFSSHGVLAVANPIADIFYSMTAKGFDIIEIATEINRKLYKLLPVNMFLAATMVALYPDSKSLHLITCGLPEHFLVNRQNNTLKTISPCNVPLGIQSDCEFDSQVYKVCSDDYLYLLTDGVFEAENSQGKMFAAESIIEAIKQPSDSGFEQLKIALNTHCSGVRQENVGAYLEVFCDVDNVPWKNTEDLHNHSHTEAMTWKTMMEFDINTLRKLNPVPVIVNALMEIQNLQEHQQAIFMIVTELFANALDHGLLKLDSSIKQTPEGFMRFYELKSQRLQTIEHGVLRLFISHQPTASGGRLTIKVRDSGDGFDYSALTVGLENNDSFAGRGVQLLESLCSRLTYQGKGNCVTAVFDWER